MAIPKEDFRALYVRYNAANGRHESRAVQDAIESKIYKEGSPQQRGALNKLMRLIYERKTKDTGGMDV